MISSDVHCQGKGLRKLAEELYDWFLSEYELGDCGEAELDEAEKRLTVRSRLNAAAGRQNVVLEFKLPAYRAERASMLTERFQRFTMP